MGVLRGSPVPLLVITQGLFKLRAEEESHTAASDNLEIRLLCFIGIVKVQVDMAG